MPRSAETDICIAINDYVKLVHPQWHPALNHTLNGVFLPGNKAERARRMALCKAMGMAVGHSDYTLYVPRGDYHGLLLEVKTKTGSVSDDQAAFLRMGRANGYFGVVGYGLEECCDIIDDYITNKHHRIEWMQETDTRSGRRAARKERANEWLSGSNGG